MICLLFWKSANPIVLTCYLDDNCLMTSVVLSLFEGVLAIFVVLTCCLDQKAMISVDAFTSVMGTFVKNNNLLKSGQLSAAGGWDFLPKTVQHIEDGNLNFSIGSNAYITGYYALTSLYLAATNNIPPIDIDTGASLANSSNIKAIRAMTEGELD